MKNLLEIISGSKCLTFFLVLATTTIMVSCNEDDEQKVAQNFTNLVFSDEFDIDGAPDASKWTFDIGTGQNGWGNGELQYYTNRTENVKVENGYLLITAKQEAFEGSSYTSARLKSEGLFEQQYGRYEARIRLPYGQGYWPAFWLLGNNCDTQTWPRCGEIDVMEYVGQKPSEIHGSVHGPGYSAGEAITKSYTLPNDRFDTGFHVFGVEWTEDFINYYVDDVLYNQITRDDVLEEGDWVFDHPFYMILNLAIGGSFVGSPNAETQFPQTMLVDYVRVYQ